MNRNKSCRITQDTGLKYLARTYYRRVKSTYAADIEINRLPVRLEIQDSKNLAVIRSQFICDHSDRIFRTAYSLCAVKRRFSDHPDVYHLYLLIIPPSSHWRSPSLPAGSTVSRHPQVRPLMISVFQYPHHYLSQLLPSVPDSLSSSALFFTSFFDGSRSLPFCKYVYRV